MRRTQPVFILSFVLLSLLSGLVDARWRPNSNSPLQVVKRSPLVSVRGGSTSTSGSRSSSSSSSQYLGRSDDVVSRGGHAPVKVAGSRQMEEETEIDSIIREATESISRVVGEQKKVEDASSSTTTATKPDTIKVLDMSLDVSSSSASNKIAKKLKSRNHTNLRRKVMHASFGLFFSTVNFIVPRSKFVPCMAALSLATLSVELLRYRRGFQWINDICYQLMGSSIRKHEMEGGFTGTLYFFLGVTLTAALYSKSCSTLGIMQLALADPSASYFGTKTKHIYWSRIENGLGGFGRNKGILGFLGGALFCVPSNYQILRHAKFAGVQPGVCSLLGASFALGLAGAFADLAVPSPVMTLPKKILGKPVPPFHIDDNFVVPLFSGYACSQIFKAMGWSQELQLSKFLWC